MSRAIVRFYLDGMLISESYVPDLTESAIDRLAREHTTMATGRPFMSEFEFLDEPEGERFFRFGTDDRGMVDPHAIDLTDETIVMGPKGWKVGKLV